MMKTYPLHTIINGIDLNDLPRKVFVIDAYGETLEEWIINFWESLTPLQPTILDTGSWVEWRPTPFRLVVSPSLNNRRTKCNYE